MKKQWVAKSDNGYHDVLLTVTKASMQPDGSVRWQAVTSDTEKDRASESTSVGLFQDWIDRVTYGADVSYLPPPKMPFLGVSHYPALDGYGEAGITRRMYIDGNTFKADGVFNADSPIGQKLLGAVKAELAMVRKGDQPDKPIRISAGWWDLQHYHSDSNYTFTRQAITDRCPLCEKGETADKIYQAGQLDHFAATRVPMNPRTTLELQEKSMAKITRRDDAESIIGPDEALEMERRARMVGKSDTENNGELPQAMATKNETDEGMVTMAKTKIGSFIKRKREEADMSLVDLAAKTPITDGTIGSIESGEIETPSVPVIKAIAKAIGVSAKQLTDLLPSGAEPAEVVAKMGDGPGAYFKKMRRKKKLHGADVAKRMKIKPDRLKEIEDDEEEIAFETMAAMAEAMEFDEDEEDDMFARFGKKRKADTKEEDEDTEDDEDDMPAKKGSKKEEMLARFGNKRRKTPPTRKGHMDYDEPMARPLGGAVNIKDAKAHIDAEVKMGKLYSYWDIFQGVVGNIMAADSEKVPDPVVAISQAVNDLGGQIDTLKAGLSDAFLIQESAAAYEDTEAADEYYTDEVDDMYYQEDESDHPADLLKAAVDSALENTALTGADREAAVQEAFNEYAGTVQTQLQAADPASQADQMATAIKGALSEVLTPLAEQVSLLTAKMNQTPAQQAQAPQGQVELQNVYVPQQKSMMAPATPPQPAEVAPGKAVSPVTGKPSPLTDIIRKSVGLH